MKNRSWKTSRAVVGRPSRESGVMCLAATLLFLIACGTDQAPAGTHVAQPPPPSPPPIIVGLETTSYVLAVEERVTAVAHVSGTDTPVTWGLDCEGGQASIATSGNSAILTALAAGTCFLSATEGEVGAWAIVSIPPLGMGDPCTASSQCGPDAPKCALAIPACGTTCTRACTTAADCPIRDAYGNHVPCRNYLCQLVREPDWSCP